MTYEVFYDFKPCNNDITANDLIEIEKCDWKVHNHILKCKNI